MKTSRLPSGKVKEAAGMGGDKMMVDIDSFLDVGEEEEQNEQLPPPPLKSALSSKMNNTRLPVTQVKDTPALGADAAASVDLGAFLDDLKEHQDPNPKKKSLTQRHPRVSIAGVTDVQEAPKHVYHQNKGRGRRREPVTESQEKEALKTMKDMKENEGLKSLVKFLKKNAGVGPNDEMAAVCCDFIVADMLMLDRVDPRHEKEHVEEIHDLGIDPYEENGEYRAELLKRDNVISENTHVSILKALDKDCEPEHAVSFTRCLALLCVELSQITSKVKLKSKTKSFESRYPLDSRKTMSFEGAGPVSRRGMAKLQSWLNVDGDGRGEEVLGTILSVMAAQAENPSVVGYCLIILSAATAVMGPRKETYFIKHNLAQTVCDTLVFQSGVWFCSLYGIRALLGPCDGSGSWVSTVAAANGIVEVLESLRRHMERPQVTEPACKLLLYLVTGHDSDTERRRNKFVESDGVTMILKVLTSSDMYVDANKFFNEKALSDKNIEGKLGTAKRVRDQNELRLKAATFKAVLSALENVVGGTSKLADERRIKLIGSLCDELCDMISTQQDVPEVQEAGFRVLGAFCESTKKGVSEAFIEDANAAGATALACDVLFNRKLRKHPGPANAVFKLIANMCRDQSAAAETCRASFVNGKVPKACANILQGSMVSEAGSTVAESLALAGIKVLHNLSAGLQSTDRVSVLRSGGPAAVTAVLTMHADRPLLVTAGADALRVMTLATWKPPSRSNVKVPTLRDLVLGWQYGNSASKLGRELIIQAKAHIVICAALSRKQVDTTAQSEGTKEVTVDPAFVGMVAACARFLGALAMDSGPNADVARDALMAVNAHKLVCAAMKPDGELKQASRAMLGCIEALRHFAGSGENSTSLLRREVMSRNGDELICAAMRAHPTDLEIQRAACCALRNLSFGGREEGDKRRTRLIKYEAHTRAATALRMFLAVESEPARMIESTALHVAAVGLLRNLSFGGGKDSEARRVSLMKTKAEELVLATIAVTTKCIGEAKQRGSLPPPDLVECLEVCLVCLGNLMSGTGWQVENRRYDAATIKKVHIPVLEAMATYPKSSSMQFSCLVSLSNFCMGDGTGADMVRALVVEHELGTSFGSANDAVSMCCKAMRRFMKNLMVAQAGIVLLANLCTATSKEANEIRAVILAEGGHELVLYAMEYFPRKSEEAGAMITAVGVAFLQNLTAGEGAHRPRQLLLSDAHLDFLPVLADIMDVHLGDQVITGHAIGLLGNLCIGADDNDGPNNELPGAERRRQEIMGVDGVQLIANVLRSYRGSGNIMKGAFKAVAAICEGKGANADKRRDSCFKARLHVLICETLKNPNVVALRDEDIVEGGRLALGCIMYDSKGRKERRQAIRAVMSDYELKMHTQWCFCLRKGAKEYQPFSADNRFTANDEGDVFEEEGMASTLKSHKWSNLDKEIADQGGDDDEDNASVDDFTVGGGGGRRRKSTDGEAKSWSNLHRRLSVKKDKLKDPSLRKSTLRNSSSGPTATLGDDEDYGDDDYDDGDDDYDDGDNNRRRSKSTGGDGRRKSSSKSTSLERKNSLKRTESLGASGNFKVMQQKDFRDDDGGGDGGDGGERKSRLSSIFGGVKRSTSLSTKDFGRILSSGNMNNGPTGTIGGEDDDNDGYEVSNVDITSSKNTPGRKYSMPTLFLSKNQADAMVDTLPDAPERNTPSVLFDESHLDMGGGGENDDVNKEPGNLLDIEAILAEHTGGGLNSGPTATIGDDDEEGSDDDDGGRKRRKSRSSRSRSKSREGSSLRKSSSRRESTSDRKSSRRESTSDRKSSRRESTSDRKSSRRESTSGRSERRSRDEDGDDGYRESRRESTSGRSRSKSSATKRSKSKTKDYLGDEPIGTIGGFDENDLELNDMPVFEDTAASGAASSSSKSRPKLSSTFSFFGKKKDSSIDENDGNDENDMMERKRSQSKTKSLKADEVLGDGPSGTIGGDDDDGYDDTGRRSMSGKSSRRESTSDRKSSRRESTSDRKSSRRESTSDRKSSRRESTSDRKESRRESTSDRKESRRESTSDRKESRRESTSDRKESRRESRKSSTYRESASQPSKPLNNMLGGGSGLIGTIGEENEDDAIIQEHFLQRKSSSRRNSTGGEKYQPGAEVKTSRKSTSFAIDDEVVGGRSRGSSVPTALNEDAPGGNSFRMSSSSASGGSGTLLARLSSVRGKSSSSRPQRSASRFAIDDQGPSGTIGDDDDNDDEENDEVGALLAGMAVGDDDGVTGEAGLEEMFKKQRSSRSGKL